MGLNVLTLVAGFCLLAVSAIGNIVPCTSCLGFWASNLGLFILFVKDGVEPRLSRLSQVSLLVLMACMSAPLLTHGRTTVFPLLYKNPLQSGLSSGSRMPLIKDFETGYVVVVTNCSLCNQGVSDELIAYLSESDEEFFVLAHEAAEIPDMDSASILTINDNDFRRLRLLPTGAPHAFEIKNGRVVNSRSGREMLSALKRREKK